RGPDGADVVAERRATALVVLRRDVHVLAPVLARAEAHRGPRRGLHAPDLLDAGDERLVGEDGSGVDERLAHDLQDAAGAEREADLRVVVVGVELLAGVVLVRLEAVVAGLAGVG